MAEDPQVIQPENVVGMGVREDRRVHEFHLFPQQLDAEFRRGVDDEVAERRRDEHAGPRAVVAGVVRRADRAVAADDRHADARSGAKQNQLARFGAGSQFVVLSEER